MARSSAYKKQLSAALYYARRKNVKRRNDVRVDPVLSAPPSIDGIAEVGLEVTVIPGEWSDSPSLSYEWRRASSLAVIARGTSYTFTEADVGEFVSVTEIARTATGFSSSTSEPIGPVVEGE
mgnify:CR=1 FL=1